MNENIINNSAGSDDRKEKILHTLKVVGKVMFRVLSVLLNVFLTLLLIGMITGVIVGTVFAMYIKNFPRH